MDGRAAGYITVEHAASRSIFPDFPTSRSRPETGGWGIVETRQLASGNAPMAQLV